MVHLDHTAVAPAPAAHTAESLAVPFHLAERDQDQELLDTEDHLVAPHLARHNTLHLAEVAAVVASRGVVDIEAAVEVVVVAVAAGVVGDTMDMLVEHQEALVQSSMVVAEDKTDNVV